MTTPDAPQILTPQLVLQAYSIGYFPMADHRDAEGVGWVRPEERGTLPVDGLHIPRSLRRAVRRAPFEVRTDTAFASVMQACAAARPGREETWINQDILSVYAALHRHGFAHSVEAWADGALVGGLYGVSIGAAFFGESMFSVRTDASKICLVHLAARLRAGGYVLHDTQFVTDHLARFGARPLSAAAYERQLAEALAEEGDFNALKDADPDTVLALASG